MQSQAKVLSNPHDKKLTPLERTIIVSPSSSDKPFRKEIIKFSMQSPLIENDNFFTDSPKDMEENLN